MYDNDCNDMSEKRPALFQQGILFVAVCFLIAYRQPVIFNNPRFWAEEGTYFYSYAFSHGWLDTVFHVVPLFGFYSLAHNIAGLLATFFTIEKAPFVTISLGFFSHLLPCCLVIFGKSPYWDTLPKKILLCLGFLLFPFSRIWLNTTYIHFTLALSVFIVLLEEMEHCSRMRINFYRSIVIIGGLSGAVSCFLAPVYILKAWRTKLRENILLASLLSAASVIQIIVFIYSHSKLDPAAQTRFVSYGIEQFRSIIHYQFGISFFGYPFYDSAFIKSLDFKTFYFLLPTLYKYAGKSAVLLDSPVSLISQLLVMSYVFFVIIRQIQDKSLQIPVISFVMIFILSSAGSVNMTGGPRYAFVPCAIMLIMFMTEFYNKNSGIIRKGLAAAFILLMLLVNGYAYRMGPETFPYRWDFEVSVWRKDNRHIIKIWPENWNMVLTSGRR